MGCTATDADSRVGQTTTVTLVRDPQDRTAPVVAFAPDLEGALVTTATGIIGTIEDTNLKQWVLELTRFGTDEYVKLASGTEPVDDSVLAGFDPDGLTNGFYELRLRATDISDRTSSTSVVVEANSNDKSGRYARTETDLSVELGGTTLDLVRAYDSLSGSVSNSFGNGWQFANVDADIQTDVPVGDRTSFGIYEPFRIGTSS